jgi:hypothetical protein
MLGYVLGGWEGGGAAGWAGLLLPIHEDALVLLNAAYGFRMEIVGRDIDMRDAGKSGSEPMSMLSKYNDGVI